MAQFQFRALNAAGAVVKGQAEAPTREALLGQLRGRGLFPLDAEERGAERAGRLARLLKPRGVSQRSLAAMTQELAMLLKAGLDLDRALAILLGLSDIGPLRAPLVAVRERVRGGASLADALAAQEIFPKYYVAMVRAGEFGGALDEALQRLSDYVTRRQALQEAIVSALIYPALLLITAGLSVGFILFFVIPEFQSLFADAGKALPLPTQIVLGVGEALRDYGWIAVLAVAAGIWWLRRALRQPAFRLRFDGFVMRIPVIGPLIVAIAVERFMRTFGALLTGGVPVPQALALAKDAVPNSVLAQSLAGAAASLREGEGLAQRLAQSGVFPPMTIDLIRIGEETGKLHDMLLRQADLDEVRIKHRLDRLLALLVPALTIMLGIVVATLIGSLLVAILSVNDLALN